MTTFSQIRWKNFLATGNSWTEIDLEGSPMSLIVGANGAGKSTLLDAICFVLFNKPFRKFNKSDVVNSVNLKDCVVELIFRTTQHAYLVRRGMSPAVFEIFKDSKKLEVTGAKDSQTVLEGILGFNFKTFTQVAILGASSFVPFMKLAAAERRAIIEDLLDIQVFSAMNVLVKDKLTSFKNSMGIIEVECIHLHSKIETLKKAEAESKKNFQAQVDDCKKAIDFGQRCVQELDSQIEKLYVGDEQTLILNAKLKEVSNFRAQINAKLKTLMEHSNFFTEHENCPTCRQEITETFRTNEIEKNKPKMSEMADALKQLEVKEKKLNADSIALSEVKVKKADLRAERSKHAGAIQTNEVTIQRLLKKMSENTQLGDDISKATGEWEDAKKQLETLREDQRYYTVAASLLKDNGIKAKIIKQYLPVINKTVNEYLKSMDFFVNIEFDEQFNEVIKSRHRDKFTYEHFSEGERKRIDLALLLTWRAIAKLKARMDTNLLILDEVFDSSLDESGIDGFMKILETWDSRNVFVISHRGDILADSFSNVIKFEKEGNFSRRVT